MGKKLSKEKKLEIYHKKKEGMRLSEINRIYGVDISDIKYLIRLVDTYGPDVLNNEKTHYSAAFKMEVVETFLSGTESQRDISIKYRLPNSNLIKAWVKQYTEEGCVILEKKKGRRPMKKKEEELKKPLEEMTPEEQVEYWKKRAIYAEAEAEYLKKLNAVVQARKARQRKKK